ncbi:serine hydrolase domain-containing protein [Undibacterium sp.]|jgi:D-aminopeptidase|uniref:serine hydrolase domain-containing protein n=1 Tax=Undibacterium sp. TaxID=1914977 RepID=UPI002C0EFF85|nr:serine hydrolase domain-containing protein [Undibacterium sp.]HTD05669.1 serine hydrolase domain-containing protein [Undibacterium sp.]
MSETRTSPTPETPAIIAGIDALLEPLNRSDAPGLVIGVNRDGKSIYRRGIGMASLEQGVANTPHTRMRIASTSKHFTALGVLLLAEQGLLNIDDDARRYLPELPQLSRTGPSLRQLMNHTGGWRGHDELWLLAHGLAPQPKGLNLPAMARQSELNFEPGTQMIYSNGGYHMLAKIIERVSGIGFGQFLKQRIFDPMGMTDTESIASDLDITPRLAGLYMAKPAALGGGWQRGIYPGDLEGSGSMVSTLDDMLRWLAHLRSSEKHVGSAGSWKQMLAPATLSSGIVMPYGFGLMRHPYRGVEVIHHNGAVLGGTSQMITVPAFGLDIMIMANGAPTSPTLLAFKVIDLLLAEELTELPEERAAAASYQALVGRRYHSPDSGGVFGFADVAGKLGLSWLESAAIPMRQREDGLLLSTLDIGINPIEIDMVGVSLDQAPDTLVLREGGNAQRFERLPDAPPDNAALAPVLCGDYFSADLDASAQLAQADGGLLLTVQGKYGRQVGRLQALSDKVMTLTSADPLLAALGNSIILNIEYQEGRVAGLRLESFRTRHMHFIRKEITA